MPQPSDWADRCVLVTGGAGFIGSHLVEDLVGRGARVTVLDDFSSGREENLSAVADRIDLCKLDLVHDDVRGLLSEGEFEIVLHLAANASVPASVEDPRDDFERNAVATFNLLNSLRSMDSPPRLLHASSAAIYGEGTGVPISEEDPTVPVAPYGVSKLAADQYVSIYARVFHLPTANVRLFTVYGPRLRKQVTYDLMTKVHNNPEELFIYGDGTQTRDFNHVSNVVESLLVVAERGRFEGDVYNVAGEESVSIRRLAEMLCQRMGVSPRFVYSGDVRPGDAQRWTADISRLKELGYRQRLALAEGLDETVRWFLGEARTGDTVEAKSP